MLDDGGVHTAEPEVARGDLATHVVPPTLGLSPSGGPPAGHNVIGSGGVLGSSGGVPRLESLLGTGPMDLGWGLPSSELQEIDKNHEGVPPALESTAGAKDRLGRHLRRQAETRRLGRDKTGVNA